MSNKILLDYRKITLTKKLPESIESSKIVSHRARMSESLIQGRFTFNKVWPNTSNFGKFNRGSSRPKLHLPFRCCPKWFIFSKHFFIKSCENMLCYVHHRSCSNQRWPFTVFFKGKNAFLCQCWMLPSISKITPGEVLESCVIQSYLVYALFDMSTSLSQKYVKNRTVCCEFMRHQSLN